MEGTNSFSPAEKLKGMLRLMMQRLWITFELFQKNGLMNHAAAGAYGFLLSAAPVLLIISFFVSRILVNSPELAEDMFQRIGLLSGIVNASDLISDFVSSAKPGLAGIISVIPLFWTARLCAQSIQRGLGIILPASRSSPIRATIITLGLGIIIIIFLFIMLLGITLSRYLLNVPVLAVIDSLSPFVRSLSVRAATIVCFAVMILVSYRIVPVDTPKWKYIFFGALTCIVLHQLFSAGFSLIINPGKYNRLYGVLGSLFLLLINVYFFFAFFLFGAQMIMVQSFSDALLFIRFRKLKLKGTKPLLPMDKLFVSLPSPLVRYSKIFKQGELIFMQGSQCQEVYYILSGNAGVYLDNKYANRIAVIDENHFFGELEYLSSEGREGRSASIKAETELSVLVLPRELFRGILRADPDTDHNIITDLSERLRSTNKKVSS